MGSGPTVLLLLGLIHSGRSLNCFVCADQEDNHDKCIKTVLTCRLNEDKCISNIEWNFVPDWRQVTVRQYYISKGCSTTTGCDVRLNATRDRCHRKWYNAWECMECCSGDLCNYYVTLGAISTRLSILTGCLCLVFSSFCAT
ncbi:PREDICTED: uncharacterized protein LOC106806404 [Priapulus caudatus]|uniref:Uncharacterized protein LOC106806404 n=1 Tax=Priapulus caudatus TaxID=37621 RepID=A0ABM1DV43_PRICU|nr:PREDICTED: uncharacterized protein LOC106806404 [Priapulus caudatus]